MASKEMQDVIDSITTFPLDVAGQREHYTKVWSSVQVDTFIQSRPVSLDGIGSDNSEWVWADRGRTDKVFCYFHGGGYVCGEPWMWRQFNGLLARASKMRCLAVGYRLAPENPFPAAVEDCVAAYKWLVKSGVSANNIVLVGDSAGGALVLSVLMALRDEGAPLPAGGVTLSPWTDLELMGESVNAATCDPLTTKTSALAMAEQYLQGQDPKSAWVSAIHGDLNNLPPIHIEAGERDILYSDSIRLIEKLRAVDNKFSFNSEPGAIHSFPALAPSTPEAASAINRIATFMREAVFSASPVADKATADA